MILTLLTCNLQPPCASAAFLDKNEGTFVMVDAVAVDPTPPTTMTTTTHDLEAVVANANLNIVYGHLGRHGQRIQCPFCQQLITTRTRNRIDGMTVICVIVLLILCWPLFWLPFCIPKCKAVHHSCPKCRNKVGVTEPCS